MTDASKPLASRAAYWGIAALLHLSRKQRRTPATHEKVRAGGKLVEVVAGQDALATE